MIYMIEIDRYGPYMRAVTGYPMEWGMSCTCMYRLVIYVCGVYERRL